MNVRARDLGSFIEDAKRAVEAKVKRREGMTIVWGGEFESKERAMARLRLVLPIALLITFGLLFNAFRKLSLAILVLLNVPFDLKDKAKALGAKWDPAVKKWWIKAGEDPAIEKARKLGFLP